MNKDILTYLFLTRRRRLCAVNGRVDDVHLPDGLQELPADAEQEPLRVQPARLRPRHAGYPSRILVTHGQHRQARSTLDTRSLSSLQRSPH